MSEIYGILQKKEKKKNLDYSNFIDLKIADSLKSIVVYGAIGLDNRFAAVYRSNLANQNTIVANCKGYQYHQSLLKSHQLFKIYSPLTLKQQWLMPIKQNSTLPNYNTCQVITNKAILLTKISLS